MTMICYKRNQKTQEIEECPLQEVLDFIQDTDEIECDTETYGLNPREHDLLCIQFGNSNNQYLVPWEDSVIPQLKPLLESTDKTFIFHNAKFDLLFLIKKGIIVTSVYDTMLAEMILYNGIKKYGFGLNNLVQEYCEEQMSKEIRSSIAYLGLTQDVIDYSLNDVMYLSYIKAEQSKRAKKYGMDKTIKFENHFVPVIAYSEFYGINFDTERWQEKAQEDLQQQEDLERQLDQIMIDEGNRKFIQYGDLFTEPGTVVCTVNWASPAQVVNVFKSLGLEVMVEEQGEEKDSVGKLTLQRNKGKHPIVKVFSEYIKVTKSVSSFGLNYIRDYVKDGKIYTVFNQLKDTGRMSSGNTRDGYPNLQQVPRDERHRSCFISRPGYSFICADYSGQEQVIFANKCQDTNLLAFYDEGLGDMHSYVGKLCFPTELDGMDLPTIKKERPDLREKAKGAGFAITFGGNGYTIANNLGLTQEEGEGIYTAYAEAFPEMFDYFDRVSAEAKENGYIRMNSVTGRMYFFDFMDEYLYLERKLNRKGYWTEYRAEKEQESNKFKYELKPEVKRYFKYDGIIKRKSYNYPVQGTGADCTKYAAYLFYKYLIEHDLIHIVFIANIIHDEILVDSPEELATELAIVLQDCMETAGGYFCKRVPLSATPVIAKVWKH